MSAVPVIADLGSLPFWRGTTIAIDSRLRIGRAIAKTEEEAALELMAQLKAVATPRSRQR